MLMLVSVLVKAAAGRLCAANGEELTREQRLLETGSSWCASGIQEYPAHQEQEGSANRRKEEVRGTFRAETGDLMGRFTTDGKIRKAKHVEADVTVPGCLRRQMS